MDEGRWTRDVKRILIVEVNWLGDVLFSTPFIRAVRNNFPNAYIACIAVPRVKEILEGNPHINEIIIYDEDNIHRGLAGKIKFIRYLKKYNFDTVFLLHRSFTRTFIAFLAGIPERIGYYTAKRGFLLTQKPPLPKMVLHRAGVYLGLASALGLKIDDIGCDFFVNQKDIEWADNFLKQGWKNGQKLIIFNPGGNWIPKRWPVENFAKLGKMILSTFGNAVKIIISGSAKDLELADKINEVIDRKATVFCGKTTLKQLAALFKKSDLIVSNDSGPFHISVAVGSKVIGIFGPTSPQITGPYKADSNKVIILRKDIGCNIPCYNAKCNDYKCMSAITAEEVFEAVKKLL